MNIGLLKIIFTVENVLLLVVFLQIVDHSAVVKEKKYHTTP